MLDHVRSKGESAADVLLGYIQQQRESGSDLTQKTQAVSRGITSEQKETFELPSPPLKPQSHKRKLLDLGLTRCKNVNDYRALAKPDVEQAPPQDPRIAGCSPAVQNQRQLEIE